MSEPETHESEWDQLIEEWRPIWEEWNEVMKRLTLAFASNGIPSQEDLDLEEKLMKQRKEVEVKMDEFRATRIRRQRNKR